MDQPTLSNCFDASLARQRCVKYRRRILDVSQRVSALHIAPAFSCLEIVDCIYHGLMHSAGAGRSIDAFLMSKGHGCMAQYAILEDIGVLPRGELERYCTASGLLGAHPDYGCPGIEAATGALGHGLAMALGMAIAERNRTKRGAPLPVIYTVLSDGEMQEGSTWEALMLASSLGVSNLVAVIDNNDFQSLGRTSETHPTFYPLDEKLTAFGWEVVEINGHDAAALYNSVTMREGRKPFVVVAKTVKGRGVQFMENMPIWHYRSPNPDEYRLAVANLAEVLS